MFDDRDTRPLDATMNQMKGQAIPLFSYHLIRDHLLRTIAGEHQGTILYWAGKDLARQFTIEKYESLNDIWLELGWGNVALVKLDKYTRHFTLQSPFFETRQVNQFASTFSLECGFLTETVSQIENKKAEGEFVLQTDDKEWSVEFTIYMDPEN